MRIAIFMHYFPPEISAPSARLSDLGRLWVQRGPLLARSGGALLADPEDDRAIAAAAASLC